MLGLTFWRLIYRTLLVVARPAVHLRLKLRQRSEPAYAERIPERFGTVPADIPEAPVWFHTVSAGETIAAAPLIEKLRGEFPQLPFLVTTMTPTGSAQVRRLLGDRVAHCYAPYDFPDAVRAFFRRVRPRLLVLMETELWPNMLRVAAESGVPAMLVNGRLSARSARGYARVAPLTRTMLASLTHVACQYPDHAARFRALGAPPERLLTLGSVKFDVSLPADHVRRVRALRAAWLPDDRPAWIAASTHDGEETVVLAAHRVVRERHPRALLILVPRHPSRADAVSRLVESAGFRCGRLSAKAPSTPDVLVGDTMGELLYLYGLSAVAFVGGSLVGVGGHNPIEAAVCRQPLLMGPHTHNFDDVVAAFVAAACLTIVAGDAELAAAVSAYLSDGPGRERAAENAAAVVRDNRGASDRLLALLRTQLAGAGAASVGGQCLE
jgi:3-deoxy-D-manno-octulosonic-acid transferase